MADGRKDVGCETWDVRCDRGDVRCQMSEDSPPAERSEDRRGGTEERSDIGDGVVENLDNRRET